MSGKDEKQAAEGEMTAHKRSDPNDKEDEALAEALRRAIGTFVRTFREKTDTHKSAQSEALVLLERDGALNVAALALRRNVTHQTMRLVVAQLESAKLIERQSDPSDRRSQLFSLSDAGKLELQRSRSARASKIGSVIKETLSVKERETLKASIALLSRMSDAARE